MLLFPQKEGKSAGEEKPFYVLSPQSERCTQLAQLLRLTGFQQVESVDKMLGDIRHVSIPENACGVIVDIAAESDYERLIRLLLAIIPRSVWCCVVGDSDSISLAQSFADQGIHYFHFTLQREALTQAIISKSTPHIVRNASTISILGCKGGVGNTTLAWQLANRVVQFRQMSTLLIQGIAASQDLDLIADKKLLKDVVTHSRNLDIMAAAESAMPDLTQEIFRKYNFVLFEQAINTASKETLRQIIEQSACIVLILDRSMISIRVVNQLTEIIEAMNRARKLSRRLILCLNDSRPVTEDMLNKEDIASLLGRSIDIVIPYKKQLFSLFTGRHSQPVDRLALQILGEEPQKGRSFFSRLHQKGQYDK